MSGEEQARHGCESYSVVGEGLPGESGGGRTEKAVARMATTALPFRFSRMGPARTTLTEAAPRKSANAMTCERGTASYVPAGFTYLGQFIDHDLTLDKTRVTFGDDVSPADPLRGCGPRRMRSAATVSSTCAGGGGVT
jgi:hypothetical protein